MIGPQVSTLAMVAGLSITACLGTSSASARGHQRVEIAQNGDRVSISDESVTTTTTTTGCDDCESAALVAAALQPGGGAFLVAWTFTCS